MKKKCEHNKDKYYCTLCGGKGICEHKKYKNRCELCCTTRCTHGFLKHKCKQCCKSFCHHGVKKNYCKSCNGKAYCEHGRQKSVCKECKGSCICEHDKVRNTCVQCDGASICEHKRMRSNCKQCKGASICEHNKRKSVCKICNGSSICIHNKVRYECRNCKGGLFCEHDKRKESCKLCGGKQLCKSEWCEQRKSNKYDGYCARCYIHLHPESKITYNYRTKELDVVNYIKNNLGDNNWICNRAITDNNNCCSSGKKPDMYTDMGSHVIIIEIDENQHKRYEEICENKRICEISIDFDHRPILFIRFNPDEYTDKDGKKIKTCWSKTKTGIHVSKSKKVEWNNRLNTLKNVIFDNLLTVPDKTISQIPLYYDGY